MHHEIVAGAFVGAIEQVGVAQVKGAVPARIGVELAFGDGVKAFGGLPVSLLALGAKRPE